MCLSKKCIQKSINWKKLPDTSHGCWWWATENITLSFPEKNFKNVSFRKNKLEVCVPELILNKTRQDETGNHFPNWRDPDKTTSLWSRCLGKSGKNLGKIWEKSLKKWDEMGLVSTPRENLDQCQIEFNQQKGTGQESLEEFLK